jgi:hypothetical protein
MSSTSHEPLRAAKKRSRAKKELPQQPKSPDPERPPRGLTPDLKFLALVSSPISAGLLYSGYPIAAVVVMMTILGLWVLAKWMKWIP